MNGLSIEKFNLEQILMIAKEISRLYEVLWDWKSRLESKEKYEKLINDVENQFYLFHQQTFGGVGLNPNIK